MVKGATFSDHDIPFCPTYLPNGLPSQITSYEKASQILKKEMKKGNKHFRMKTFIHFCIDDYKFDDKTNGIWCNPKKFLKFIKHFDGIITPDFSTYTDFPGPLKSYNTYRMRAFGYWCYTNNIPTINNVRWGTQETWEYCFDGIPSHSVVFIGTVASEIRKKENRLLFENGLIELVKRLHPETIIIYGSDINPVIKNLKQKGIKIITFKSETNLAFKGGDKNEQNK